MAAIERSKLAKDSMDRISNLPGPLLSHILSLLPTKSAVATSVLSTKWRFLWTSITNLDFDDSGNYPKKALNMKRVKFTKFVNRVLLLLNPPCIQNFRFRCRQQLSDPFYLEAWICAAIGRTVGVLDLKLYFESKEFMELPFTQIYCNVAVLKLEGHIHFNIPAQASVCFPRLQTLHLSCIKLKIATKSSVSFPNLKILHFIHVKFEDEDSPSILLSSCPVLDDLVIKKLSSNYVLCLVICIPSLTRLELDFMTCYNDHFDKLQMVKLHNLKSLSILGHHVMKTIGTSFTSISSSGFHNLTQLELEKNDCSDWSVVIKDLLENMENLEHLTMEGHGCRCGDHSWWTEPCNVPKCLLSRVTTISLSYRINVLCDELEMLRYFLKNAEALELLTIANYYNPGEKLKLVEMISMFPRGSRTCQVAFA